MTLSAGPVDSIWAAFMRALLGWGNALIVGRPLRAVELASRRSLDPFGEERLQARDQSIDRVGVVIQMARNAHVPAAAEIDNRDFDAQPLPDGVLQRIGDGARFVGRGGRKGDVG